MNNNVHTRAVTAPVSGIESLKSKHPDKRYIALYMPGNRTFHRKVTTHWKGKNIYRCKQLFASYLELEFRSMGIEKEFMVGGEPVTAMMFEFNRIYARRLA